MEDEVKMSLKKIKNIRKNIEKTRKKLRNILGKEKANKRDKVEIGVKEWMRKCKNME